MTPMSFSEAESAGKRKRTRREIFLAEMEQVGPWSALLALIEPVYSKGVRVRQPYPLQTMLRIHLMQNWFGYSDPAMEEALYEAAPLRRFAGLSLTRGSVPDETTILNFRRLLETYDLAPKVLAAVSTHLAQQGLLLRPGTIVDATIIHAPSSTKNRDHARDAEMHQTKKGPQWYFGMKAHIGVDEESGLVHTLTTPAANAADVTEIANLLHGKERSVWADAGDTSAEQRMPAKRGRIKALPEGPYKKAAQHVESLKAEVRARVEHPYRVLKRQFSYTKVRFKGLTKNTAQLQVLFALVNLWLARKRLLAMTG